MLAIIIEMCIIESIEGQTLAKVGQRGTKKIQKACNESLLIIGYLSDYRKSSN